MKSFLGVVGGLALLGVAAVLVYGVYGVYGRIEPQPTCQACQRAIHSETYYRVFLEDGSIEHVCCPRCGLRFQEGRTDVTGSDVADFNTRERVDAEKALFVEDSSVAMCRHEGPVKQDFSGAQYQLTWDRCLPSLVAFSTREAAESFRRENGGIIKTYAELKLER